MVRSLSCVALVILNGCTTSPDDKPLVPADHTVLEGAALHKSGHEEPFETESGCWTSSCHHADLRGGWALVDGPDGGSSQHYAPSCYQCHGVEWDDTRPRVLRVLHPTADAVWRHGQRRAVEHWAPRIDVAVIELLDGDTVVATLAAGSDASEVIRVDEVDAAWGTGAEFRVRVTSVADERATGNSFTICDTEDVVVTRPLEGAAFSVGGDISVEWTCAAGVAVDIDVVRDGRRVGVFREAAGNNGVHQRVVPAEWGTGSGYRLRVTDVEGTTGFSAPFDIVTFSSVR